MRWVWSLLVVAACQSAPPVDGVGSARTSDGVRIDYEVRGHGEPTLVFLHGFACHRGHWHEQLPVFARDHRVVAIDLAGHGTSAANRETWSVHEFARDVQAVADAQSIDDMILVGHSMGGPVALAAAAAMPGRVRGVIGVDTLHDAEFEMDAAAMASFLDPLRADFEGTMRNWVESMVVDDELADWIVAGATTVDRDAAFAILHSYPELDVAELFRSAGVPIRCVNAAAKSPGRRPTEVGTNRRYADFDAAVIEDVGHYPMLERPTECSIRLREFVDELAGR